MSRLQTLLLQPQLNTSEDSELGRLLRHSIGVEKAKLLPRSADKQSNLGDLGYAIALEAIFQLWGKVIAEGEVPFAV